MKTKTKTPRWDGRQRFDRFKKNFRLWKDFSFEAAHSLTQVPSYHQCRRLHGHSYRIRVHCSGLLVAGHDWLVDYADISASVKPFIDQLDHRNLNQILKVETTAENLAWWFAERIAPRLKELSAVEVFETPTSSVMIEL